MARIPDLNEYNRISNKAIQRNLKLERSCWKRWSPDNQGKFRLVDLGTGAVVAGHSWELSLEDVADYLQGIPPYQRIISTIPMERLTSLTGDAPRCSRSLRLAALLPLFEAGELDDFHPKVVGELTGSLHSGLADLNDLPRVQELRDQFLAEFAEKRENFTPRKIRPGPPRGVRKNPDPLSAKKMRNNA